MGFAVTMVFMVVAFGMAFVLRYTLAKFPYPEIQTASTTGRPPQDGKEVEV